MVMYADWQIYFMYLKPDGSHMHREKREVDELKICQIYAVADYLYFQNAGQSSVFNTANHIVSLFILSQSDIELICSQPIRF